MGEPYFGKHHTAKHTSSALQVPVPKLHWEDFIPGSVFESGPRLVTREEIVAFAAEFDPQPMHLDEEAGRASMLGGLSASGWHSCCLLMRMISDGFVGESNFLGAPGVEEVRWLAPLRPGEQLTARATVLETRASKSRPDIGFVKFQFELINAAGVQLLALTVSPMFGRRDARRAEAR
jgi:acyl dehydratase